MLGDRDTIAAIGTARGMGALGIVRVSGAQTSEIISRCFRGKDVDCKESHRAHFGLWQDSISQTPIDEVIVLVFADGRGYTGELSADVICHGGVQVSELILNAVLSAGARLARPGEFTYRAVMNDKLDLTEAESVLEIIQARTPRAVANALNNIRGALSGELERIESELTFFLANLEASIDFTTEDIQPVDFSKMKLRSDELCRQVEGLLETYVAGRLANQGVRVVLAGKPNSGKSSILNALVGRERSIVDEAPGTTRDTVEEEVLIDGQLFKLIDTAGLRTAESKVEEQGIHRTHEEIKGAEIVVYIIDSSVGISPEDSRQIHQAGQDRTLVAMNKADLIAEINFSDFPAIASSTVTPGGMDSLRRGLVDRAKTAGDSETNAIVSTERQRRGLLTVAEKLKRSSELLMTQVSPEFISFELKEALLQIQEILGKNPGDDTVMDRIFKEFCIGK